MINSDFVRKYLQEEKNDLAKRFVMDYIIPNMNSNLEMEIEKFPRYIKDPKGQLEPLGFKLEEKTSSISADYKYWIISCGDVVEE